MTVKEARVIENEFYKISNPNEEQEFMYIEAMDFLIQEENKPEDKGDYFKEINIGIYSIDI
jgi:hypothetical protein